MNEMAPKFLTFLASAVIGVGSVAASTPAAEGAVVNMGWAGVIMGGFSALIAGTGMIMAFLDKRKVAEAATSKEIITAHEGTIAFLKQQLKESQEAFDEARKRGHKLGNDANVMIATKEKELLLKEKEVSTLRALLEANNIPIPDFPDKSDPAPVFHHNK